MPKISKEYTVSDTPSLKYHITDEKLTFSIDTINSSYAFVKGVRIPNLQRRPVLALAFGRLISLISTDDLYRGIELEIPKWTDCYTSSIKLAAIEDRVFVSAEFKYLQTEETIGVIEYNHWTLFVGKYLRYREVDSVFEVRDPQNNIVFCIYNFEGKAGLAIGGYFVTPSAVINIPIKCPKCTDTLECIPKYLPNWKQRALTEISKSESILDPSIPFKY